MRQRRVTGIEERLAPYVDLILRGGNDSTDRGDDPARYLRWYERTSPRYELPERFERVYAEFGCGRGRFINILATDDPEGLYIGIEGCKTIVIRGLEKTRAAELSNVRYIDGFVNDAEAAFGGGALDGIFLNFSDPWPKERHAGRRLTSPEKAEKYYRVLKEEGFVSFKTDGEAFYEYSRSTIKEAGFHITGSDSVAVSVADANGLSAAKANANVLAAERAAATPTEYELKFQALGKPIYSFIALKR